MLFDTHAHVTSTDYDSDRDEVIERLRSAGVVGVLEAGIELDTLPGILAFAAAHPEVHAAVGIHPNHCPRDRAELDHTLGRVRELAAAECVVAIGETGLDHYRDHRTPEMQVASLEAHLDLAGELGLPVVLHCRQAWDDLLAILEARHPAGDFRGVFHCFSGDPAQRDRAIALGAHLGLGGVVTFKSADALRATVAAAPVDRIVLETDCPYLAPHPHRGTRNEPALLPLVARQLAEIFEVSPKELGERTTKSARALFGLGDPHTT
jgi:TatD DNase family protein